MNEFTAFTTDGQDASHTHSFTPFPDGYAAQVSPPWADNDNEQKLDEQEDQKLAEELEKSEQEDTGTLPEQIG